MGDGAREIGVAVIGDGLMAKEHTMALRNVRAVFGDHPHHAAHRAVLVVAQEEDLAALQPGTLKVGAGMERARPEAVRRIVQHRFPHHLNRCVHRDLIMLRLHAGSVARIRSSL